MSEPVLPCSSDSPQEAAFEQIFAAITENSDGGGGGGGDHPRTLNFLVPRLSLINSTCLSA